MDDVVLVNVMDFPGFGIFHRPTFPFSPFEPSVSKLILYFAEKGLDVLFGFGIRQADFRKLSNEI